MSLPRPGATATGALRRLAVAVQGEHDVGHVIAAVQHFCAEERFGGVFAAHVATAASELANNLWMHARHGGELRLRVLQAGDGRRGVELQAEDDGPGIADVAQAMEEGYSTAGGLGCGLPGVQRLMDEFAIASRAGSGTCVTACKWSAPPAAACR